MGRWEESRSSLKGEMNYEVAWPGEHGQECMQGLTPSAASVDMCFWVLHLFFLSLNFLISTFLVRIRDNVSKDSGRVVVGTLQHYTVLELLLEGQTNW